MNYVSKNTLAYDAASLKYRLQLEHFVNILCVLESCTYTHTHKHTLTDAHTSVSAYAHLQTCILRGIDFVYSYQITFYLLI